MIRSEDTAEPLFASRPWDALPAAAMGHATGVPSMLNARERRLYTWLGARWARGEGAVVDLGCFVGGSAACLAQGLLLGGHGGKVHAYDRFTANDAAKQKFLYPAGVAPFDGRDTLPLARQLLAPWEGHVEFHRGDILDQTWPGHPIELLVVDIAKSTAIADHVAARFFPALIPGRSVLVQQDCLHDAQPWLPAQMELLADHFLPLAHVAPHSMVYLCTAAVTEEALRAARTESLDDAGMLRLLAASRTRHSARGIDRQLQKAEAMLRANPGVRDAGALRRSVARRR